MGWGLAMRTQSLSIDNTNPIFELECRFFECDFHLKFAWIERHKFWSMDINGASQEPLARGIKILTSWPIFHFKSGKRTLVFLFLPHKQAIEAGSFNLFNDVDLVCNEII